ncbi:hypothetical protein CLOSTHATH_07431, partial [Hungatella hathewayi DSM 13479]
EFSIKIQSTLRRLRNSSALFHLKKIVFYGRMKKNLHTKEVRHSRQPPIGYARVACCLRVNKRYRSIE